MSTELKPQTKTLVWELGLDRKTKALLKDVYKIKMFSLPLKAELVFNLELPRPDIVLCGTELPEEIRSELVQIVGLKYIGPPIYYISRDYNRFERSRILSEGFSEVFLLPFEQTIFEEVLNRHLSAQDSVVKQMFESIRVADLNSETDLKFDINVFLRANRKFICFAKKGQKLSASKIDKLRESTTSVYVSKDEMAAFYKYVKEEIQRSKNFDSLSITERKVQFTVAIKNFFRAMLYEPRKNKASPEALNKLLLACKKQITDYITKTTFENWSKRFVDNYGDNYDMAYLHACNVATYAGFLSVATNIGNPEDLALAGILHDLGMVTLPEELLEKKYETMSPTEKSQYHTHVQKGLNELSAREVVVPANVIKMVSQHHEQYGGRGFPAGLSHKVMPEAQLLALADDLDELTSNTTDRDAMHPLLAIRAIAEAEDLRPLTDKKYDPQIIQKILDVFESSLGKKLNSKAV